MMFCGRKECSGCKFFKRDGCVTVPECAYKDLKEKLNKAKEALRFYADSDCYEKFGGDGLSEIDEDGGEWAQNVLKEVGE